MGDTRPARAGEGDAPERFAFLSVATDSCTCSGCAVRPALLERVALLERTATAFERPGAASPRALATEAAFACATGDAAGCPLCSYSSLMARGVWGLLLVRRRGEVARDDVSLGVCVWLGGKVDPPAPLRK